MLLPKIDIVSVHHISSLDPMIVPNDAYKLPLTSNPHRFIAWTCSLLHRHTKECPYIIDHASESGNPGFLNGFQLEACGNGILKIIVILFCKAVLGAA